MRIMISGGNQVIRAPGRPDMAVLSARYAAPQHKPLSARPCTRFSGYVPSRLNYKAAVAVCSATSLCGIGMRAMNTPKIDFNDPFYRAVIHAIPVGVATALVTVTCGHYFWNISPAFSGSSFVAAGCGGFLMALTFLVGAQRRQWFLAIVGAVIALALPAVTMIMVLILLRIPLQESPFWTPLPAGLVTGLVFRLGRSYSLRRRIT